MNDTADVPYNNRSCHHPQRRWGSEHPASIDADGAGGDSYEESEQRLSLDQIAVPEDYIRIRRRDVASGDQRLLPVSILCALLGAAGLAFIGGGHLVAFAPARAVLAQPNPNCSAQALGTIETGCVALKSDRQVTLHTPTPYVQETATTGGRVTAKDGAKQTATRTNSVTPAMKQNSSLRAPRIATIQPRESLPKLTPVPETRPTTREGWKVLEVLGETAVLEGPDGILRVRRYGAGLGEGRFNRALGQPLDSRHQ